MWLLMLEAGVALFLLVFIVWWTVPKNTDRNAPTKPLPPDKDKQP